MADSTESQEIESLRKSILVLQLLSPAFHEELLTARELVGQHFRDRIRARLLNRLAGILFGADDPAKVMFYAYGDINEIYCVRHGVNHCPTCRNCGAFFFVEGEGRR